MGLLEENHSLESISLFCFSSAAEVRLPHYCIADWKVIISVVTGYHHPSIYLN